MSDVTDEFAPAGLEARWTRLPSLSDFLLARIAEDEEAAREVGCDVGTRTFVGGDMSAATEREVTYVVREADRRALAECEVKRRFIQEAQDQVSEYFSRFILETLALPYADHPDYREEWKP